MKRIYETAVILIGTLGWWGFVYPELSAVTAVCEQEAEAEEETSAANAEMETAEAHEAYGKETALFADKIVESLGSCGIRSGDIRIKSRIMEYVYREKEKQLLEKEAEYDE